MSGGQQQFASVREAVRQHDDRLAYLENRHAQLQRRGDIKIATDAEYNDWSINRSEEDWITILGLKKIVGELSKRDWQVAAKRQVTEFMSAVLKAQRVDMHFSVLYVANANRFGTGLPILNIQLNSIDISCRFRELYSCFFRKASIIYERGQRQKQDHS